MFVTLPSATPLSAFDWFQRRVFAQRAEMNTLVKCKPCLGIWMKKLKECQKLSLIAFFRQRKTDTCYDLTLRSYEGRCEQRKEASATSTSPGFGRFGTGWLNPQSGSWNIKGMLNRQHLGWLQMLTHPQTMLTLPLSYHLCPSVLVPHCDHARRWGQTISVKERKIYLLDVSLSLWKVWFKSINLDKWYGHWL